MNYSCMSVCVYVKKVVFKIKKLFQFNLFYSLSLYITSALAAAYEYVFIFIFLTNYRYVIQFVVSQPHPAVVE